MPGPGKTAKARGFAALCLALALSVALGPVPCHAAATPEGDPIYGPQLEGFSYPWPVSHYRFTSQGEALDMAYLDVAPAVPNGRVAVLLHGKNFCAATWQTSIETLSQAGFRVIAPDQIGFCKSTKPAHYQYSFQQLAANTHALLAGLGLGPVLVMGHSTGGMLGIRYALMYPDAVDQLVLVDPIGLEDWKTKGVPSITVDQWYQRELATTADRIRAYEQATYYAGTWQPEYEVWVQMLAGMNRGPARAVVAWNSALLYDMIYTQPVVYELGLLKPPVLLMIGDKDTTAIGRDLAPPAARAALGDYPALGKAAAAAIPHAQLVEFPDLGHAPQIQAPAAFHKALLDGLGATALVALHRGFHRLDNEAATWRRQYRPGPPPATIALHTIGSTAATEQARPNTPLALLPRNKPVANDRKGHKEAGVCAAVRNEG